MGTLTALSILYWFGEKVEIAMAAKGRQTPRKPATKFAHLRKKMEKNRIAAKISKKKKGYPA